MKNKFLKVVGISMLLAVTLINIAKISDITTKNGTLNISSLITIAAADTEVNDCIACPNFKRWEGALLTGWLTWENAVCCANGTAMDGCKFCLEDKPICDQYMERNAKPSNC